MAPFYDIAGPCTCGLCGGSLQVKLAVGGKHPGQHYIHCVPCKFHYTFPPTQPTGTTTVPHSLPQSREGACAAIACSRTFHRLCARQMCKQCCIARSGCNAPKHDFRYLSEKQKGKVKAPTPVPSHTPSPYQDLISISSANPPSYQLEPLSPSTINLLNNIGNTTTRFLEADTQRLHQERAEHAKEIAVERQEERDYQAAIAASLQVPYTTSGGPSPTLSSSRPVASTSSQLSRVQLAVPRGQPPVVTVPYQAPGITNHMNADWMRKTTDNTKKTIKAPRANPNNKFVIVFWHKTGEAPAVTGVDDCPQWPTWVLMGSTAVQENLSLGNERLEFYDVCYALWVSCSPSYPHNVKTDCRLLLRRPGVICQDFETHLEHATAKPIHMRFNIAGERAAIRDQLRQRKKSLQPIVIELSDDDDAKTPSPVKKRQLAESDNFNNNRPSKRIRMHSPDTPTSTRTTIDSPRYSSPSMSPATSRTPPLEFPSSPPSPQHEKLFVPVSNKAWPSGMYTVDMEQAFREMESKALKILYRTTPSRLSYVFGREIHTNTFYDQLRIWKKGSESQRQAYVSMGRSEAGLWSNFRNATKP